MTAVRASFESRGDRHHISTIAALVTLSLAAGCGPDPADRSSPSSDEPSVPIEPPVERARIVAGSLGEDLAGLVSQTLATEGPVAAVRICSEVAQERTAAHARDGITVRRVSERLRNRDNSPDRPERDALQRFANLHHSGSMPEELVEVEGRDGRSVLRYLRPIVIQPGCLACHGPTDTIERDVREILEDRYPLDRATGYQVGDLRGAISVTVELD